MCSTQAILRNPTTCTHTHRHTHTHTHAHTHTHHASGSSEAATMLAAESARCWLRWRGAVCEVKVSLSRARALALSLSGSRSLALSLSLARARALSVCMRVIHMYGDRVCIYTQTPNGRLHHITCITSHASHHEGFNCAGFGGL